MLPTANTTVGEGTLMLRRECSAGSFGRFRNGVAGCALVFGTFLVVPTSGCSSGERWECVNRASPCGGRSEESCNEVPGVCFWGALCRRIKCYRIETPDETCGGIAHCAWNESVEQCFPGRSAPLCPDVSDQSACEAITGCEFVPFCRRGEEEFDCRGRGQEACESDSLCEWQIAAGQYG